MEAFRREREKANLSATAEIPMQYITSTIEYLLLQYGRYGANVYQISKNMIEEAIWYSGYIEAEVCKKGYENFKYGESKRKYKVYLG